MLTDTLPNSQEQIQMIELVYGKSDQAFVHYTPNLAVLQTCERGTSEKVHPFDTPPPKPNSTC